MSEHFGHIITQEEAYDLRSADVLVVNTEKDAKLYWMWVLYQTMAREGQAIHLIDGKESLLRSQSCNQTEDYDEPKFNRAQDSAHHKAEYLNTWFADVMTSGADSVFYLWNEKSHDWEVMHKMSRDGEEISVDEMAKEYLRLRDLLVMPKSGKLRMAWDLSATYLNGEDHHFSEILMLEAESLDLEVFNTYFDHARESGLIKKASTRIAMIEAMLENDPKARIGLFTPEQVMSKRYKIDRNLIRVDEYMRRLATWAVLGTCPMGVFMNDSRSAIFEKADEVAGSIGLIKSNESV